MDEDDGTSSCCTGILRAVDGEGGMIGSSMETLLVLLILKLGLRDNG